MKKIILAIAILVSFTGSTLKAQEEEKSGPEFTAGADIYSNYIWRGSKLGTGPAFQPTVKFTAGGFTAGVWGSFDASGYVETDPYISYALPFGLTFGLTDYYYPMHVDATTGANTPSNFFEFSKDKSYSALEANLGYTIGGFSASANYIFNESAGAASAGGDKYFQIGYAFKKVSLFAGAGDGWHTSDGDFNFCNIGLSTSKVIKITDSFSIPVTGQLVVNPDKKQLLMAVGLSF